jgi:DNA-binding beta-propeller fold protein YncE
MRGCYYFAAIATAVAVMTGSLHAETYKQVASIAIPGEPIADFAVLVIDQTTGLGYLADKDNRGVVVFDTRTDKYVSRITGFVGKAKSGTLSGPNGLLVTKGGAELWVSDGDSTIKVVDLKTGKITTTIATGGKRRANGMAFDPKNRIVIAVNSNDDPTFINLLSSESRTILAKISVPQSAENLERSAWHAQSGMFYTAIPVLRDDPTKGILAQTDGKAGKLVKLHVLDGCHPHSLQIVSERTIFLGCSSAHGPNRKPGGDMAVFDIPSEKIVARHAGQGGNGGSTLDPRRGRYFHSTSAGVLMVVDTATGKLVQKVTTSRGARSSAVSLANGRVYVATSARTGPCGGCIAVYAAE